MAKTLRLILMFALVSGAASPQAQDDRSYFRVIGYYSLRAAMAADQTTVPFDKLTHINLSFLNPDPLGNFTQDYSALAPFIEAAHRSHVKVLVSIGGGGAHPYYHDLLKDEKRGKFVEHSCRPRWSTTSTGSTLTLAKEKASGIMIWQVLGDAPGEKSLLHRHQRGWLRKEVEPSGGGSCRITRTSREDELRRRPRSGECVSRLR